MVVAHSGIKGMRWGRRQYQNPDGTWTELGLLRRRQASRAVTSGKDGKASPSEKLTREAGNAVTAAKQYVNRRKQLSQKYATREDLSRYSDAELQAKINRLNLERRYSELSSEEVFNGYDRVNMALDTIGTLTIIAGSAAGVATAVHTIRKG